MICGSMRSLVEDIAGCVFRFLGVQWMKGPQRSRLPRSGGSLSRGGRRACLLMCTGYDTRTAIQPRGQCSHREGHGLRSEPTWRRRSLQPPWLDVRNDRELEGIRCIRSGGAAGWPVEFVQHVLKIGETYLIFLREGRTDLCSGTAVLARRKRCSKTARHRHAARISRRQERQAQSRALQ